MKTLIISISLVSLFAFESCDKNPMKNKTTKKLYHSLVNSELKQTNILNKLDTVDVDQKIIDFLSGLNHNIIGKDELLIQKEGDVSYLISEVEKYSGHELPETQKDSTTNWQYVYLSIPYFKKDSTVALVYRYEKFIRKSNKPEEINELILLLRRQPEKEPEWKLVYDYLLE